MLLSYYDFMQIIKYKYYDFMQNLANEHCDFVQKGLFDAEKKGI